MDLEEFRRQARAGIDPPEPKPVLTAVKAKADPFVLDSLSGVAKKRMSSGIAAAAAGISMKQAADAIKALARVGGNAVTVAREFNEVMSKVDRAFKSSVALRRPARRWNRHR